MDGVWRSIEAMIRKRDTPTFVGLLARMLPLPKSVTGKFIKVLASDGRFELLELDGPTPRVQMRGTDRETTETTWLARCMHSLGWNCLELDRV